MFEGIENCIREKCTKEHKNGDVGLIFHIRDGKVEWIENIYSEILELIEKSINLKPWLRIADSKIDHGKIVIHYHQGKITSYDI